MITLLLADDHAIVREGLKKLFALTEDIHIWAEAKDGEEVLKLIAEHDFDVLLLDMSMPGISGVNLIARVHTIAAQLPIIMLTMHNEPQIARRAVSAGVSGYLTKDCDPAVLLQAIRKVAKGGRFFDPVLAEHMVFETQTTVDKRAQEALSKREMQIFRLLAMGKSVTDISEALAISSKTVSTYKMRLMQKMAFSSNADIVRYAIEHGYVE